ncbi:unnamed protein product [Dovyalis caffra]|uniref:Uncharacterized protein n=1 Tax=Dovyalis caffra TaxID=77055 RepID=A0AAV1S979_9ROSI|nr:unnamed protein product [Dovyalis caffra]
MLAIDPTIALAKLSSLLLSAPHGKSNAGLVADGRVPFCASKLLSIGIGFQLVRLSWAANQLKDTVIYISKHASMVGLKDEEIIGSVDKSFLEIYFQSSNRDGSSSTKACMSIK